PILALRGKTQLVPDRARHRAARDANAGQRGIKRSLVGVLVAGREDQAEVIVDGFLVVDDEDASVHGVNHKPNNTTKLYILSIRLRQTPERIPHANSADVVGRKLLAPVVAAYNHDAVSRGDQPFIQ